MDLYKDKMSLTNLEKKINSELNTKINSSSINHNILNINKIRIQKEIKMRREDTKISQKSSDVIFEGGG